MKNGAELAMPTDKETIHDPDRTTAAGRCPRAARGGRHGARIALVLALWGCGVSEPLEDVRIGVVQTVDGEPSVTVPSVVRAGEPFEVSVVTVGGPCVYAGETEVEVQGDVAVVTPYDRYGVPRPGVGCLVVDDEIWHTTTVTLDTIGEALVVVRSRAPDSEEVRELEYEVTVSD